VPALTAGKWLLMWPGHGLPVVGDEITRLVLVDHPSRSDDEHSAIYLYSVTGAVCRENIC